MKILIADDHSVIRHGVSLILRESFSDVMVGHAETFDEALGLISSEEFDLLMLDINLPGGNNVSMINDVKRIKPNMAILVFSAYDEEQFALRYIQAGANGYLNKLSAEDKITEAVSIILNGGEYISDSVRNHLHTDVGLLDNPFTVLSGREREITILLATGYGNLEISNKLNIGMSTVSTYKNRIFEKLGITNVVSLAEKYRLYNE